MPLEASSSFHRCGQRDERRRRLLTDDLSIPADGPLRLGWPDDGPPPQKSEHYGDAEFLKRQWRLLDFVPRRLLILAGLLVLGAAIIVGLEMAYGWMLKRLAAGGGVAAALDLGAKGSLACWFSSLALLAASAAALLIYTVRRHRTDDYPGRYRVWIWAAGCWFLMASDQAASLREGFRDTMNALTGTPLLGDGTLWWAILYLLAFGAVGSRLFIDMRSSRLSTGALLIAATAYGLAIASRLGWTMTDTYVGEIMFQGRSEMAGSLMLLAAMSLHARYVILDAEGLLPRAEPERDDDSEAEHDDEEENEATEVKVITANTRRWQKIDPPHATPQPAHQRVAAPAAVSAPATSLAFPQSSSPDNHKLTKAERKALKKRLLQERMERQR